MRVKHHLSQAAQNAGGDVWDTGGVTTLGDEDKVVPPGSHTDHILPAGETLDAEQRLHVQVQHCQALVKSDLGVMGEMLIQLGGERGSVTGPLSEEQLQATYHALKEAAREVEADATIVFETCDVKKDENKGENGEAGSSSRGHVAAVLVRRRSVAKQPLEVRVAVIGNVDSGKSTLVGVLTRSMLDNGRGSARSKVFKHDHESASGRTSAIGQHNLCLNSVGGILNDGMFKNSNCADYVSRASKVVTLVDLAGHERYFKTTAYGLTGHLPDYACLLVGANAGVVGMCKEHLGIALALKVPIFFVVTKVDICPAPILRQSLQQLNSMLKKPGVRKRPFLVNTMEDVLTCARGVTSESLAPVFLTSAVTGRGLDLLRLFVNLLPQRQQWAERQKQPTEFIIDETFSVPGVGTVVAGTVKQGVLNLATPLLLGPDIGDGAFRPAAIKSIHYKRLPVGEVVAGQTAALALKKVKRERVRKGMVLAHEALKPTATWEFCSEIAILTHATTIQPRYQAVIHCEIIRQAARVVAMDRERLRSGDRATVLWRFLLHPEYLTPGTRFVFREGRTKGIGMIVSTDGAEARST